MNSTGLDGSGILDSDVPSARMSPRWEWLFVAVLAVAAVGLLVTNLGDQYLWQDEAQTALIARTVLTHGVPLGHDGKNYFSQEGGAEYGSGYVWKWHTWLPFYVLAGFFGVFGFSTFVARLPFALFGVATVVLTYFFARSLFESRRTAMLSAAALVLSVPFLLLCRQCRYYSPAAFFPVAGLYAYLGIIRRKRYATIGFVLAAMLLFHTQWIYFVTLLAAVLVHVVFFHRERLRAVLWAGGIASVLVAPWAVWFLGGRYGERFGERVLNPEHVALVGASYVRQINTYVFPFLLVLVPVAVLVFRRVGGRALLRRGWRDLLEKISLPLLFVATTLAVLCVLSPFPFFRYLAPVIPMLAMMAGVVLEMGTSVHPVVGPVILAVLTCIVPVPASDGVPERSHQVVLSPIWSYAYELTHHYTGPMEGIIGYLKEHAKPGDTVAISYGDLPVKFYTDLRVIGALTGEDLSDLPRAQWLILRKYQVSSGMVPFQDAAKRQLAGRNYEAIPIDCPDLPYENREDPSLHHYWTVRDGSRVVIHRRKADPNRTSQAGTVGTR